MPTHLFKKARKNSRYIRHFEYNNIRQSVEKQVDSKLRRYPNWFEAMKKYPPTALLAKAPCHFIQGNHPSSFPYSIKYPTPTGKHKRDTFKSKMIPPPLHFDQGLDFKLATDFPFELAKPQFLSNTEEELKKDVVLQQHFEQLKQTKPVAKAYDEIVQIFKERQLEKCDNLYNVFEKIDLQGQRQVKQLEQELTEKDSMTNDERLKVEMLLMIKKKHDLLYSQSTIQSNEDAFIDIKDAKPVTYKMLHKERQILEEHKRLNPDRYTRNKK